ncbi:MAG: PRC-barrel domain-containing protein [Pseudomonadota bacterium]
MTAATKLRILAATTALVAVSAAGAWAQQNEAQTSVDLSSEAQALEITTYVRAMHGMPVVNHSGEPLGQFHDLVVDFSDKSVIYALMSTTGGGRRSDGEAREGSGEQEAADDEAQPEQTQRGQQGEQAKRDQQARMESGALYPIPIEAIQIVDRSTLQPQMAQGQQQTGQGQQKAQGEQQMTDSQDQAAQGKQQAQSLAELTVEQVVGMEVRSDAGEKIADIEAIVQGADQSLAVIGVGGFLGMGEKKVGVPLDQFTYDPAEEALVLAISREQLESAAGLDYEDEDTASPDMRLATLMEPGQQAQSEKEAQGEKDAEGEQKAAAGVLDTEWRGEVKSLEGKVLMIAIDKERLQQAPSFRYGNFPEIADAEWQKTVLAFYQDLLSGEDAGAAESGTAAPTEENAEEKTAD